MSLGTTSWPCQIKSSVCWSTSSERMALDDRFWVNCNPFKMTCTKVLSLLKSQLTPIASLTQKQETRSAIVFFVHFPLYKSHLFIKHISPHSQIVAGGRNSPCLLLQESGPSEFRSFGPLCGFEGHRLLCIQLGWVFFGVWWTLLNSVLTEMGSDRFTKG